MQLLDGWYRILHGIRFLRGRRKRGIRGIQNGDQVDALAFGGSDAVFQVERHDPMPVDALIVGVFRHRCRPLADVLFGFGKPGTARLCFVHTLHGSREGAQYTSARTKTMMLLG